MKILDKKKLESMVEPCPGNSLRERLDNFCKEKGAKNKETAPSFSSLINKRSDLVVHLYGENQALVELLKDTIWHPTTGRK